MSFDQTVLRLEGDNICVMQGTPDFVSPEVKFNELCFKCFFHTGLRSLLSQFVESIVLLMRELFICFSHLWSLFSETPLIRWSTTLPSALDQTCGQKASFKWHPVLQYHQQNQHLPQKCVYLLGILVFGITVIITLNIFCPTRSVGVVTYVLLTGLSPFLGDSNIET